MGKHIQGKDGKMQGSIGDGITAPTTVDPRSRVEVAADQAVESLDLADRYGSMHVRLVDELGVSQFDVLYAQITDPATSPLERHRLILKEQSMLVEHCAENPEDADRLTKWAESAGFGEIQTSTRSFISGPLARRIVTARNAREDAEEDARLEEKQARKAEQKARARERRSAKGADPSLMTPSNPNGIPFETSCASHPDLVEQWHPDNPCTPDQISLSSNGAAWFKCPKCGAKWKSTVDNRTKAFRRSGGGLRINCPDCHRGRKRSMERTQASLQDFHQHLQDNPGAWESLPPALRHSLMSEHNTFAGNADSFGNAIALGNLNGDYTLADIIAARDVDEFADQVDESRTGDDTELGAVDITTYTADTGSPGPLRSGTGDRVTDILDSARVAGAIEDQILVDQIVNSNVEQLWNEAYNRPEDLDTLLQQVRDRAQDPDPFTARVANEFLDEYEQVINQPLPDGYATVQTRNGVEVEMTPLLSQRRFAYLVDERRKVANWSGTGAGKTLSAVLAARQIDAQETVVFCPLGVKPQWVGELEASFPGVFEVRDGLPQPGEDLDATRTGKPRVWLVNYDAVSQNSRAKAAQLAPLSERVDMIVFDEAHLVKQSLASDKKSLRRGVLEQFTDSARDSRDDLAIVMQTATPVVNDLAEADSLLRLLNGPSERVRSEVTPTARNASRMYTRLADAGVRWKPDYRQDLHRNEIVVDITDRAQVVAARAKKIAGQGRVSSFALERALLPEKLSTITDRVKASDGEPVVIYSQAKTGMIEPIQQHLTGQGYRVATITGEATSEERATILRDFQAGKIDVLIGSSPIATGIDGLQRASSRMIVVSMPWTAAADDQLVGRMQRPGQHRDVHIDYILAEAKADGATWSYDRNNRFNRVRFKRTLGEAAVDGVMAAGIVEAEQDVSTALGALETIAQRLNPNDQ